MNQHLRNYRNEGKTDPEVTVDDHEDTQDNLDEKTEDQPQVQSQQPGTITFFKIARELIFKRRATKKKIRTTQTQRINSKTTTGLHRLLRRGSATHRKKFRNKILRNYRKT
jgi:hypothetical protein